MWLHLRDRLDALYEHAKAHDRRVLRKLIGFARLLLDLWRQLVVDQSLTTAASLAFTTLLSLVPVMAVTFAVFRAFTPSEEVSSKIGEWLLGTLLADSVSEVTNTLQEILERVRGDTLGLLGFLFLLITAVSLFMSVEQAFNRIWRVSASRPLLARLTSFYAVITLSPGLVALGYWANGYIKERLAFGAGLVSAVAPWLLQVAALVVLYKLLPHARVRWRAALIGSIAAAFGFAVVQWGFDLYVGQVFSGSAAAALYGSLALIPVFFLWVYLVWIIVLAGAEVAYVAQNHRDLSAAVLARRGRTGLAAPTGYLIARVFFEIAGHFRARGGGLGARQIADRLQIEQDEVQPALKLLKDGGLVLMAESEDGEVGVPALPLDQIALSRLVALGEGDGYAPGQLKGGGAAQRLEAALLAARQAEDAALSIHVEQLFRDAQAPEIKR